MQKIKDLKYIEGIAAPFVLNTSFSQPQKYAPALRDMLKNMQASEIMPEAELQKLQERRLRNLLIFAQAQSPYISNLMQQNNINPTAQNIFLELAKFPLLTRRNLQENYQQIESKSLYQTHLPTAYNQTSGSSGEPVKIKRSAVTERFWHAYTMREHQWYQRDFSKNMAVIRALSSPNPIAISNWGNPANILVEKMGNGFALNINTPINQQLEWLLETNATYLSIYPSNLNALLDLIEEKQIKLPHLKEIRSIGETLSNDLRQRVKNILGVITSDVYSSQELCVIAIGCPKSNDDLYHIMAESLIVEILKEDGTPCNDEESGRVVITDLINFATPILRYDIRDYAIKGHKCNCGRTLPTIKKVLGRERNMAIHNGQKFWPLVGFAKFRDVAPIQQYQVAQISENEIELRLVTKTTLNKSQEENLKNIVSNALGFSPEVTFKYYDQKIPVKASGKFEEFVCMV